MLLLLFLGRHCQTEPTQTMPTIDAFAWSTQVPPFLPGAVLHQTYSNELTAVTTMRKSETAAATAVLPYTTACSPKRITLPGADATTASCSCHAPSMLRPTHGIWRTGPGEAQGWKQSHSKDEKPFGKTKVQTQAINRRKRGVVETRGSWGEVERGLTPLAQHDESPRLPRA